MQEGLEIIVCVKQVPDPEGPPSAFVVDSEALRVVPKGIPPVISPFDENALEVALRLKEAHGGSIALLSAGSGISQAVMLKAMATGADELLLVEDELFDCEGPDSSSTAALLAAAIRKKGGFDLILTGRQAADTNSGQVGLGIAQMLDVPAVSLAQKVEVFDGEVTVERVLPDGHEIVRVTLPALVTISHEVGDLRYPRMADIKTAKERPRTKWSAGDLGVEPASSVRARILELSQPVRERQCCIVDGDTPEEAGERLALKLREAKLL
ncbi:MAG: electron transfer flavoprotein subunit beta/FixA family protein [Actinomycetota bacterium]|nr:electron transfer flavoprotein subunit beta/FixA family protein [Actinomycetota bacterium]